MGGTPLEGAAPTYDEVGLLPDADDPYSRHMLYSCSGCGALVDYGARELHTRFHRALASLTLPTTHIGGGDL